MTVQDIIKLLHSSEEITLYDVDINGWRTGVITKDYIPPAYMDWEVTGLTTDMDGSSPVLELGIRSIKEQVL
jgi:hypothetical protein